MFFSSGPGARLGFLVPADLVRIRFSFFLAQFHGGSQIGLSERKQLPRQEIVGRQVGEPDAFLRMGKVFFRSRHMPIARMRPRDGKYGFVPIRLR